MDELNLNSAWYDIKIIYRYPQEVLHERVNYRYMAIKEDKHVKMMFNRIQKMPQVNAAELYISSEPLAEVDTEMVQQTTTSLQFTTLDDGCTAMGGYTMGDYMLPSQDHVVNTGETLHCQETHLEEDDEDEDYVEDEDKDKDHVTNDGESIDGVDEYEERIERGDLENDVDDHEVVPHFEEENMEFHDKGDADDDIGI
ncbi:serine/threonine-protein phosphatase 4 regulatory subunit 2-like [Quercus lobata]|uniref:serine/threonine-protein phosphatase 4 regulatory subunit 2-like n=1 Tax=Quercus lobata TaxID=97700 RepID=UPI001248005D|nr:serine/threonine-protein phosphatase 4 regulatory subunit 2-like [Quercus lobata]